MTGIAPRPLLGDVSGARSAAWLPRAAGCLTALVGAINIISALTPDAFRNPLTHYVLRLPGPVAQFHAP